MALILTLTLTLITGCSSVNDNSESKGDENNLGHVDRVVADELHRLSVSTTSAASVQKITLPTELNDANWGLKATICKSGGYDLEAFAGEGVNLTSVDIDGSCSGEEVTLWIVSTTDQIAGAYLTVRSDSQTAPGIWPINAEHCQF